MVLKALLWICFVVQPVFALSISPTRINLTASEQIATLTVKNDSSEPSVLELSILKWTQKNSEDLEQPSDDLLLTPILFTLPPFKSQLVRISMEGLPLKEIDQTYRLIVAEVRSEISKKPKEGIKFLLRLSLPIVIETTLERKIQLSWQLKQEGQKTYLYVTNTGRGLNFINSLALFSQDQKALINPFSTFCYVLPGSKKKWALDLLSKKSIKFVEANVDSRIIRFNVT